MFGISGSYCCEQLRQLGFSFTGRTSKAETARFEAAYGLSGEKPAKATAADKKNTGLERLSLTFSGAFSPEEIAARLAGFFELGQEVTVTVEVLAR